MADLEEKTSATEGEESTQTEETKTTESEEKSTVSVVDTPEFKTALDKAVGKGVSSIQSLLSISKAETETAKNEAKAVRAINEDYEGKITEFEVSQFAGDEEALKGYRNTKAINLREKRAKLRDVEQDQRKAALDAREWAITMSDKATGLLKKYQVPKETLDLCTTEEQMEMIAKAFPEVEGEGKNEEKEIPEFAGAGEQGKGVDLNNLSSTDLIARGVNKMNKK